MKTCGDRQVEGDADGHEKTEWKMNGMDSEEMLT